MLFNTSHSLDVISDITCINYITPLSSHSFCPACIHVSRFHPYLAVSQHPEHSGDEGLTEFAAVRPHGSGQAADNIEG